MIYDVVTNDEGQYSTWPVGRELPDGWKPTGFQGGKEECLGHIEGEWTDLTPLSVRELIEPQTNSLTTERLTLRELTPAQVAVLLDENATSDDWIAGYPLPGSKFAAGGFGRRTADQMRHGFGMYQLVRASDGLVIGEMGFHAPPSGGVVEVGFGLAESCRGAGYATEALTELVRWAFSQAGVDQVVGRTMADNTPSQGVLTRTGFQHVSRDGDIERFVLGAADLAPVSAPLELDDEGRALIAGVIEGRLSSGRRHELAFAPGTDPMIRAIREDGHTLAFVQCGGLKGVDDQDNHFLDIVVRPEAARRGLASRLLAEARVFARGEGKTGLVAATADEDEISGAWVRKHGFEVIGLHGVSKRTPDAPTAEAPAHLTVEHVDRSDAEAVEEFVALAVATFAQVVLPGGVKLRLEPETVRQIVLGDGGGLLLACRRDGRAVGWLATDSVQDGAVNLVDAQLLAECAGDGVPEALLASAARWADRERITVTAIIEEKGQAELAKALARFGFDRKSGRTIWRLTIDTAAAQS
ncbi:GNAT family N-acetyltransferase [Streptomyces sp. NPDC091273]|uniref:GNAT family N-acetyltransferase n=1 Tax=unclassified Streptomyces TaxID=2593676 RepID=UPI0028847D8F|nr:GNAT family N-acetyltransferase [Streptomyces sp. DSM 41633]